MVSPDPKTGDRKMEKSIVKEGYALAEKESRERQVQEVKRIVQRTLEKIADLDTRIKELEEDRRILKMDLDDLKDGKLGLIEERQAKDERARRVSVVIIVKETVREKVTPMPYPVEVAKPWYQPYYVTWSSNDLIYTDSGNGGINNACLSINCSVAKDAAVGAYEVGNKVVNLR